MAQYVYKKNVNTLRSLDIPKQARVRKNQEAKKEDPEAPGPGTSFLLLVTKREAF